MSGTNNNINYADVVRTLLEDIDFKLFAGIATTSRAELGRIYDVYSLNTNFWNQSPPVETEFLEDIAYASSDPLLFDALNRVLAMRLTSDLPMSKSMKVWVSAVLIGERKRPKSSGGPSKSGKHFQGHFIAILVLFGMRLGLTTTRNEASEKTSSCDAVVDALAAMGHSISYDKVVKDWQMNKPAEPAEMLEEWFRH